MPISIKVTGLDDLQKGLSQDFRPLIAKGYKKVAEVVWKAVVEEAPKMAGRLAGGIHKTQTGEFGWNIYESHKHGLWIREGTIGHSIFPRRKKALYWPGLPHPIAWTPNPGIRRPNPYPERAVAKSDGAVQTVMEETGAEIARKIG